MNSSLVKEYIDTVAVLSQAVQNKRFRIDAESSDFLGTQVAVAINNEIKSQYGLDLSLIDTEDRLIEYGEHLQNKLGLVIKEHYFNDSLSEEIKLLDAVQELSTVDYLKNNFDSVLKDVSVDFFGKRKTKNFTRSIIEAVGITVPSYLYSIKHPEKIHLINLKSGKYPSDGVVHYLVSSKIKVKNKEVFVLTDMIGASDKPTELEALGCFFFEESNKRVDSPVRMFLQGINEYGNEVTIEKLKKKFFLQKVIENPSASVRDEFSFKILGYRGEMTAFFSISQASGDTIFQFTYMLLMDEIIGDVKKRVFL